METEEIMIWTAIALIAWIIPFIAYAIERNVIRKLLSRLVEKFSRQSLPVQLFLVLFVSVAVLRGGSKTTGQQSRSINGMMQSQQSGELEADDSIQTNECFRITSFAVSSTNQVVSFELTWGNHSFDDAVSRDVDVFMSTNLSSRNWFWLNRISLPANTNQYAFTIGEENVTINMRDVFVNAFGHHAFFTIGLDVDSDEDSLTDAFEKYVSGSSSNFADTDFDGLNDVDEYDNGTDATNPDTNGNGISDMEEFLAVANQSVPVSNPESAIRYYYDDDDRLVGSYSGMNQATSLVILTPAGNSNLILEIGGE